MDFRRTRTLAAALLALTLACTAHADDNVANPQLMQAIERLGKEVTPDARRALFHELNRATYLVPLMRNPNGKHPEYVNYLVAHQGRPSMIAIFADRNQMARSDIAPDKVVAMNAAEVWKLVDEQPRLDGVALNPGHNALPLNRKRIAQIREH